MSGRFTWLHAQVSLAVLVVVTAVISGPRLLIYEFSSQGNIPLEFLTATLSLPDYAMGAFIGISLLRWINDPGYAQMIRATGAVLIKQGAWLWLITVGVMTLSILWADTPAMSLYTVTHLLACLLTAFLLAQVARDHLDVLLAAFVVMALAQTAIAVLQALNNGPIGLEILGEQNRLYYEPVDYFRARGLSMHPNYLGGYLMIAFFADAVLLARHWSKRVWRFALAGSGLIILVGIAATLSRSAILSLGVGLLPLILLLVRTQSPQRRRLIVGGMSILLVLAGIAIIVFLGADLQNIQERIFSSREFFFADTLTLIEQSPILGVGAGNIMLEIGENKPLLEVGGDLLPVHNVYLYIWAEAGLMAIAAFIINCVWVLWRFWRQPHTVALILWAGAWLACCVVMLFDNYFWAVHPVRVTFFTVLGIAWAMWLTNDAPEPSHEAQPG